MQDARKSNRPLEGIKVVEVAQWAFVPASAGILADMGADVIKIEPHEGDPLRGLTTGGAKPGQHGFILSWENYNRGKRSITLDLKQQAGIDVLYKLVEQADVFLTNFLPRTRSKLKIDVEHLKAINSKLIYAIGSGSGRRGPEGDKGGYDAITFWARAGIATSVRAREEDYPPQPPTGAFGDTLSGAMLAGGIAAAIAQRAMTGHAAVVETSLLGTGMWAMQRAITQAAMDNVKSFPAYPREMGAANPLVGIYRTSDKRYVSLCMLQGQRYWPGFCEVAGRPDLITDPRFATDRDRAMNGKVVLAEMDALFASKTLVEWQAALKRQDGQWDTVQQVGELKDDPQVIANELLQEVDYGDGRIMKMVSVPMQYDGRALQPRPAPEVGQHSDEVLSQLGFDEDAIVDLKVNGVVF